ncbi:MAG: VCBS domain-containing protein [Fibrobacterota bacterium]|nr:MAG: VCBS domain-containing protein [Fibrobacterota bacterium]
MFQRMSASIAGIVLALLMTGCDSNSTSVSTNTEPGSTTGPLGIHGKVVVQYGSAAGLTVRLRSTGATTKTDAAGTWAFPVAASRSAVVAAARTAAGTDSVTVSSTSDTAAQTITTVPVLGDSTPVVALVYHELRGYLSNPRPGQTYVIRVHVRKPDSTTTTLRTWWNSNANQFTGFVYIPAGLNSVRFQANVYAAGDTNTVIGISTILNVPTDIAGGVEFGSFGYTNLGLRPMLTGIPTVPASYMSTLWLSVSAGDTTLTGAGLRAPYRFSYRIGDSSWVALGTAATAASTLPLQVVVGDALAKNPRIQIRIQDAAGDSATTTVAVNVNAPLVRSTAKLVYHCVLDSSRKVVWYDTTLENTTRDLFNDTVLYITSGTRWRQDTGFGTLSLSLPTQFWDTATASTIATKGSKLEAQISSIYIRAGNGSTGTFLYRFITSDPLRSVDNITGAPINYSPGDTISLVTGSGISIYGDKAPFSNTLAGTPKQFQILGIYKLN